MEAPIVSTDILSIPAHKALSFCPVKHLEDTNNNVYPEETNDLQEEYSVLGWKDISTWPVIWSDANICQDQPQSKVWIDESRSPLAYNFSGPFLQPCSVLQNRLQDCITIADYDLPPSAYINNESPSNLLQENRISEGENLVPAEIYEEVPGGPVQIDCPEIYYEDEESESEMLLSELKNNKLNKNPGKSEYINTQWQNDVLKQLMSKDIQSTSRQQKTIIFTGEDSSTGLTIQNIRYIDPRIKCTAMEVDHEEIIEDAPSPTPRKKKYQCDKCKRIFRKLTEFRKHINGNHVNYKVQKPKKDLVCSECDKKFSNYFKYQQHINGHGDPDLECPKCHKVYASKSTLKVHLKIHDRKYPCTYCTKSFAVAEPYKKHLKRHAKFVCMYDGCMFLTDSETTLDDHHDVHLEKYNDISYRNNYGNIKKQLRNNYVIDDNVHVTANVDRANDYVDPNAGHMDNDDIENDFNDHAKVDYDQVAYSKNCNEQNNKYPKREYKKHISEIIEEDFKALGCELKMEDLSRNKNSDMEVCDDIEIKVPKKRRYVRRCTSQTMNDEQDNKIKQADSVIAKVMSDKVFLGDPKKVKKCKSCVMCSKSFDRLSDLKRHLIEHIVKATLAKVVSSEKGALCILCEICQKETFSAIDKYKQHLREHAKLTIYKCGICDKPFSDSSNFSKHKKIHNNFHFQCDKCHRKFNSKEMLIKHINLHEKNKMLECRVCGRAFHFQSMLNKHVKAAHERPVSPKYCCPFCGEGLKTLRERWEHQWQVHNIRKIIADCLVCSAKFRKFSDLKRHCSEEHDVDLPPQKNLLDKKFMSDVVCVQSI